MDKYVKLGKIGEGAHGVVYRARLVKPLLSQPLPGFLSTIAQAQHEQQENGQQPQDDSKEEKANRPHEEEKRPQPSAAAQPQSIIPQTPDRSHLKRRHEGSTPASQLASSLASHSLSTPLSSISSFNFSASSSPPPASAPPAASVAVGSLVAIKKIRLRSVSEGLSMDAIRELAVLQELHHDGVVAVLDVFSHNANVNVVLDLMQHDLEAVVRDGSIRLTEADVKRFVFQILQALEYCHRRHVLHRDLKPGNVLLAKGRVKLADFGLAKLFGSPERRLSPQACTLWYRAPELLFGSTAYGPAMDVWSVGCIMAELHWRRPLFAGPESEIAQLQRIFSVCGTPQQRGWEGADCLPEYIRFEPVEGGRREWRDVFLGMEAAGVELIGSMLELDPAKRVSAREALQSPWFSTGSAMTPLEKLPMLPEKDREKSDG